MEKTEDLETLIFGSGNEKGFLLIGSLLALQNSKKISKVKKIIGISVGSIIGTFVAIGMSFSEILNESLSFNIFEASISGIDQIIKNFSFEMNGRNGILDPSEIKRRIDARLIMKYGKSLTFKELHLWTDIELVIVITDRSNKNFPRAVYLSKSTTPNYSVSQAVLESCMLPGIFNNTNFNRIDGVFADPFPYEQAMGQKTLAMLPIEDLSKSFSDSQSFFGIIVDIYHALLVPIQIFLARKIEEARNSFDEEKLEIVILKTDPRIPFSLKLDEKIKMIVQGFFQTSKFI